jgi:8-oxo-dGTP diphosphatase
MRSVAGIARRGGKYFVGRRAMGGAMGGRWEFPGGKVEEGESDAEALRREWQEEFGIPITVGAALAAARFEHKGRSYELTAYEVSFEGEPAFLAEHSEWAWMGLEALEALEFADSDRRLLAGLKGGMPEAK